MPTLRRYLLFSCLAVALAWTAFAVKVGQRSPFAHLRTVADGPVLGLVSLLRGEWDDMMSAKPPPPAPPTAEEKRMQKAQAVRVEHLKKAAALARPPGAKAPAAPPKKTRVDERISPEEEKALDALLTRRVQRGK